MNLIKGKFYENGQVIPLEFGNKKQIEVMQMALRQYNALVGDGLQLDVEYQTTIVATFNFKCICGQTVRKEKEVDQEDDVSGMEGICKCPKCKQSYMADFDDDGELIIKLVK